MMKRPKFYHKISTRITVWICIIVACILFISNISAYFYFSKILLAKEYDNEKDKIELLVNQMNYIVEDLERFALSIAIDEDIQGYLTGDNADTHSLERKLGRWEVQRDYIFNIVLENNEEDIILSDSLMISGISRHMYRAVLGETLDCNIKENQLFKFFPEILTVNRLNNQNALLSFGMNINHLEKYNVKLGKLIINLDYDKIVDIISRNLKSVDFEQFYWVSKEGLVLYANEIDKKNSDYIQKVIEIIKKKGSHQFEMLDNYVVTSEEDASGWRFISITSMGDIRSRINYILYFFLLTGGVFSTIGAIGIERMIRKLMNPITKLKENMDRIKRDEFAYQPVIVETEDEFQVLADGYNNMMERIQSYIEKSVNYEKEKRKMEMNLLLAQINPHFIYNTLNTIIYLAHKGKTDIIAEVTRSFISLLQDSVKIHDSGFFSSVENELEVIRNYLDIQSKRYINKFETKFQIGEDVYQIKIIRSILQPIVENSLLHGIFRKAGKGNILISISRESERLKCIIEDDGAGMSDEDIRKIMEREYQDRSTDVYSIGLKNIRERLDLVYGPLYKLQIESEREKYTRFILEIPIESEIVS